MAAARVQFDDVLVQLGSASRPAARPALESSPLLAAVRRAGTTHIYADSADVEEIGALVGRDDGKIVAEVDGSTANQPLIRKVVERYLQREDVAGWIERLRAAHPEASRFELTAAIYAAICGRAANDVVGAFAGDRSWGVSLQLHIGLENDAEAAKRAGRCLRRMVPSAGVVKVPFTPHRPHCLLVARDLEREGIPVNFTSTFSARQVVAAALLADVTLTNIFMGRINQGLQATLLGEHVDLCAQRALRHLRRERGVKTLLIVASVREWQTFVQVAGCDVFTSPCAAIRDFMRQTEVPAGEIRSQLETSYAGELGIGHAARAALGDGVARLYDVEPAFIEFLTELRGHRDYARLNDGDELAKRFDQAGFGDFFYAPTTTEWPELRANKLPELEAPLTKRLPLDTLFTLLADADFAKYQEEMDELIGARLG